MLKANTSIVGVLLIVVIVVASGFVINNAVDQVSLEKSGSEKESSKIAPLKIEFFRQNGGCGEVYIRNLGMKPVVIKEPSLHFYRGKNLVDTIVGSGEIIIGKGEVKSICFPIFSVIDKGGDGAYILKIGSLSGVFDTYIKAVVSKDKLETFKKDTRCCSKLQFKSNEYRSRVYVDEDNDGSFEAIYNDINTAVANSPANSTLYIMPGEYDEEVLLNKPLKMYGVGCGEKPVIKGYLVLNQPVSNGDLIVKNIDLEITSLFKQAGLGAHLNDTMYNGQIILDNIKINVASSATTGRIILVNATNNPSDVKTVIRNLNVTVNPQSNAPYIINLYDNDIVEISNNYIASNGKNPGIYVYNANKVTLKGNTMHGFRYYGLWIRNSRNIVVENNNIWHIPNPASGYNKHAIYITGSNNILVKNNNITRFTTFGIRIGYSNNIIVEDNHIDWQSGSVSATYAGINIFGSSSNPAKNITIRNNQVYNLPAAKYGISINDIRDTIIENNYLSHNGGGITVTKPHGTTIIRNNKIKNGGNLYGINLSGEYDTALIKENNITNMKSAIWISNVNGETIIESNQINASRQNGIYAYGKLNNLTITGNKISNAKRTGIYLYVNNAVFKVYIRNNQLTDNGIPGYTTPATQSQFTVYNRYTYTLNNIKFNNNTIKFTNTTTAYFIVIYDEKGVTSSNRLDVTSNTWIENGTTITDPVKFAEKVYDNRDDPNYGYIDAGFYQT